MKSATVILPVKEPGAAKQRLAAILQPSEREALWWAMYEDVASALKDTGLPVLVVTGSERAAAWARHAGWRILRETCQISESASVDAVCRLLASESCPSALRLPADIPLVRPGDITEIADPDRTPGQAVLVPSVDGKGTNAVRRSPPDLFPSRFGPNSLVLHTQEVLRLSLRPSTVRNVRIAIDLDDAADVRRFMQQPSETRTYSLLSSLGINERTAPRASQRHFDSRH